MMRYKFKKDDVYRTVSSSLFGNIDDTAVLFEARPNFTANIVGDYTVSVRRT